MSLNHCDDVLTIICVFNIEEVLYVRKPVKDIYVVQITKQELCLRLLCYIDQNKNITTYIFLTQNMEFTLRLADVEAKQKIPHPTPNA